MSILYDYKKELLTHRKKDKIIILTFFFDARDQSRAGTSVRTPDFESYHAPLKVNKHLFNKV